MNKKLLLCIIASLIVIGYAIAQGTLNKDIEMDKKIIDAILKDNPSIREISITSTPITCDENYCYSTIYQEGLVNVNWQIPRGNLDIKQIEEQRNIFVVELLRNYGKNLLGKEQEQVSDETIINIKEKKE